MPGAHDAGAVDLGTIVAPDLRDKIAPCVRSSVSCLLRHCCSNAAGAWSETQKGGEQPFTTLLEAGVRYFDLRVGVDHREEATTPNRSDYMSG